jgi:hypothetical protein
VLIPAHPGENQVEAHLLQSWGRPGSWRFTRSGPGSVRVLRGEVVEITEGAVTFRLQGRPGEAVAFSFRVEP